MTKVVMFSTKEKYYRIARAKFIIKKWHLGQEASELCQRQGRCVGVFIKNKNKKHENTLCRMWQKHERMHHVLNIASVKL